ncbi:MAG: acetate/propionate family kinase [Acidobacteriia bacterium]|nr:acetate/propionate family kinase [Terriglobia bacterium]
MKVLVPNLGSTSLKYQLIDMDGERVLARGKIERIGSALAIVTTWDAEGKSTQATAAVPDHRAAIQTLLDRLHGGAQPTAIDAVGFKAVHGGPRYRGSFLVTDELLEAMKEFVPVAPVHNPVYIQAMQVFREVLRGVPMVAVFEPGFHVTIPERASVYGVPFEWLEKYGVRRYGFHGSSNRYISQRVPEVLGRSAAGLRLVSCHLGGSSSICAIRDGKSLDSSFGFSAQSGMEHAARCGELDPFAVLHVMEKEKLTTAQMRELLSKKSGLLGISGVSSDLRDIEEAAAQGNTRAALAIEVLVYEVKKYIGAFAAAMGGLDAVAFAGGIGENSWQVRQEVCRGLEFLGLRLDDEKNRAPGSNDRIISSRDSNVAVLVVYTNEEIIVARETVRVLGQQ